MGCPHRGHRLRFRSEARLQIATCCLNVAAATLALSLPTLAFSLRPLACLSLASRSPDAQAPAVHPTPTPTGRGPSLKAQTPGAQVTSTGISGAPAVCPARWLKHMWGTDAGDRAADAQGGVRGLGPTGAVVTGRPWGLQPRGWMEGAKGECGGGPATIRSPTSGGLRLPRLLGPDFPKPVLTPVTICNRLWPLWWVRRVSTMRPLQVVLHFQGPWTRLLTEVASRVVLASAGGRGVGGGAQEARGCVLDVWSCGRLWHAGGDVDPQPGGDGPPGVGPRGGGRYRLVVLGPRSKPGRLWTPGPSPGFGGRRCPRRTSRA